MGKPKKSKHKGIRDPLKQREEREQRLIDAKKINNPPKEDQDVSKSFRRFMAIKQSANKIVKQNNKNKIMKKGQKVTVHDDFMKFDGVANKTKNESNKQHLRRVENLIKKKKVEAEYAKKFNVQIIRDEVTGEIKMKKDPLVKANQKKLKLKRDKEKQEREEAAQKSNEQEVPEFPLVKYQNPRAKKKMEEEEFKMRDVVKFGEVVKEPPSFNLPQKPNTVKTKKREFLFSSKFNK